MSSGVAYGFEMDTEKLAEEFKKRGVDLQGNDRTMDYEVANSVGPEEAANADNEPYQVMKHSPNKGTMFVNMSILAYINTLRAIGVKSNERAYSSAWIDSLTSPARPSDRRAQVRYGNDAPERQFRMLAALLPVKTSSPSK